ncbi:MAG: TetR family transcriptional regulator [Burkholderiaceae bacterium]|nr:TetR family transcriptional regulator [Burkholderiaceae bacterium]
MNQPVQNPPKPRRGRPPKLPGAEPASASPPPDGEAAADGDAGRTNDPERTMADILAVATREFADKGLAGARIDEIAAATRTSKRMIYYYYGSKDGLYVAVLEEAYRHMRAIESELHLDDLEPAEALRRLVVHTVDYQAAHPDFIRLVMTENIHRGEYLARSKSIRQLNVPAIEGLRRVYERGVAAGQFRPGLDPVDLHMSISALSVFNVANRHTFGLIFKRDLGAARSLAARREAIVDMIERYVKN